VPDKTIVRNGPGFALTEFRCRIATPELGAEETADAHQIVFVRSGLFVRETARGRAVADPNHVLFFNADEPYRVQHPLPGGDVCLALTLPTADLLDILAERDAHARDRVRAPFPSPHAPCTARAAVLQRRLLSLSKAEADSLELQEVALDLAAEAVGTARPESAPAPERAATRREHREAVEGVVVLLAARLPEAPTLGELARAVGYSPFHLARLFRRETGLPIHRYLTRLRLRLALERLAEDGAGLTDVALDLGFADHSHFTNAFRREFGAPPAAIRRRVRVRRRHSA
jgi:AraC-like DNA-binding protein